jgi:hypothetical protein
LWYRCKIWNKEKGAFYLILFRISVLKQRLFGEVFWLVVFIITIIHHLSPNHILQWRV